MRIGGLIIERAGRPVAAASATPAIDPPAKEQGLWDRYSQDALALASWYDFTSADVQASQQINLANQGFLDIRSITWFIPDFHHAYYGGIYTILRFADYLRRTKGITNQFALVGTMDARAIADKIAEAFPALAGSAVRRVGTDSTLNHLEETDAAIATLWTTAYFLLTFNRTKRKFYFIQDYEPLFYPAGATFAQVEASYRFGLYGIANTPAIKDIYESLYDGQATSFVPCVDTSVFHPGTRPAPSADAEESTIFFYGRPGHPRNGFELGSCAMRKVKERLGARVRIISAGANWEPAEFGLDGVVENLGLLEFHQTAELYRRCDLGLAMMFTRHPSYLPFEFMASGCLVIANYNSATQWLLRDGENCLLAEASASSIAETVERAVHDRSLRTRLTANALSTIREKHSDWGEQIEAVHSYMIGPRQQ